MNAIVRYRSLLALALVQGAATVGRIDDPPPTRFGIGAGAGILEYLQVACDGTVLKAETAKYKNLGGEVEHWLAGSVFRVRASAGYQWADSLKSQGPVAKVLLALEGNKAGIGLGIGAVPDGDFPPPGQDRTMRMQPFPTAYLRLGSKANTHLRAEVLPVGVQTTAELARIGVGHNQFDNRRMSGFVGLGLMASSLDTDNSPPAFVVELYRPVSPRASVGVHAFVSQEQKTSYGLTGEFRWVLSK
jgi:hypothetical protein